MADKRFFKIDTDSIVTVVTYGDDIAILNENYGGTWIEDPVSSPKREPSIGLYYDAAKPLFHEKDPPEGNGAYTLNNTTGYWEPSVAYPSGTTWENTTNVLWFGYNDIVKEWQPYGMASYKNDAIWASARATLAYPTEGKYYEWIEKDSIVGDTPTWKEVKYTGTNGTSLERVVI